MSNKNFVFDLKFKNDDHQITIIKQTKNPKNIIIRVWAEPKPDQEKKRKNIAWPVMDNIDIKWKIEKNLFVAGVFHYNKFFGLVENQWCPMESDFKKKR